MSVSSLNFNVLDTLMKENIKKIVIEAVRQDRAKVLVNSFNEWRVKVGCQVFVGSGVSSIGMSEQAAALRASNFHEVKQMLEAYLNPCEEYVEEEEIIVEEPVIEVP